MAKALVERENAVADTERYREQAELANAQIPYKNKNSTNLNID